MIMRESASKLYNIWNFEIRTSNFRSRRLWLWLIHGSYMSFDIKTLYYFNNIMLIIDKYYIKKKNIAPEPEPYMFRLGRCFSFSGWVRLFLGKYFFPKRVRSFLGKYFFPKSS